MPSLFLRIMPPFRSLRVLVPVLALAATACGDLTKPKAAYANAAGAYTLYAYPYAPANAYSALSFLTGATLTDANYTFDVTFDLSPTGDAKIIPVRAIGGSLAGSLKRVGLQIVPGAFEALREAPETGYDTLSVQTVKPGQVVAVELQDINSCLYSLGGSLIYAKVTVDSVSPTTHRVFTRTVVDPNCGYRQVMPDTIPTN